MRPSEKYVFLSKSIHSRDELASDLVSLQRIVPGSGPIGRAWLARPFPSKTAHRVLLVYMDFKLALPQYRAFLRYSARFRRAGIAFRAIAFDEVDRQNLPADASAVFLQAPYRPAPGEIERALERLSESYPNAPISFFDWSAPTDVRFAASVAPYVSAYVKKALLRDVNAYRVPTVGHTQLVEYFSPRYGLPIEPPHWPLEPAIVDRLVAGPSFYSSRTLIPGFERAAPLVPADRPIDVHARIATSGEPWYAAMRQEAKDAVSHNLGDLNIVSEGKVSLAQFMTELSHAKLCFSPFGYGELCWRDFEAMLAGSVLIKQDMSHILTAPDIFHDRETYFAVRWDLGDLEETIRDALARPAQLRTMAQTARAMITRYLAGPALEQLVERLISAPPRSILP